MTSVGFEPAIRTSDLPQNHALDLAATGDQTGDQTERLLMKIRAASKALS